MKRIALILCGLLLSVIGYSYGIETNANLENTTFIGNGTGVVHWNIDANYRTGSGRSTTTANCIAFNTISIDCAVVSGPPAIDLNSAADFGILAGTAITATSSSINNTNIGIHPGIRASITGFPPSIVVNGSIYGSDDSPEVGIMLAQAKSDLLSAYLAAEGASSPAPVTIAGDQGGLTLYSGIYKSALLFIQAGDLTLDAQGDPNARWIFQIASAITTFGGVGGNVILANGAQAKNITWQVGSSATIGNNTTFKGNILAYTSITMNTGSTIDGRLLAMGDAVTLSGSNTINQTIAQTTKWTGNVSNVWSDSDNWNNGVPNMNKTAVIGLFSPSKPDPVIFSNTNFKKLQMTGFGRAYEVKVEDDVAVSMETLSMSNSDNPMDITFDIGNGNVTVDNYVDVLGQISIENGSLVASGGLKVTNYLNAQSGNITVGTPTAPADFLVDGGDGIVNLNNSGLNVYGSALFDTEQFHITSGAITISEDFTAIGDFDFFLNQATLDVSGNMSVGNSTVFRAGSGTINVGENFLLDGSGELEFYLEQGDLTISGESAFAAGGIFRGGTGTMELQGDIEFSGGQDFKAGTSTVTLNGNIDITHQNNNREVTFYNLILAENASITSNIDVIVENDMHAYGNFQVSNKYNLNVINELQGSENIVSPYPYLVDLEVVDSHTLRAVFNQDLTATSAELASNYQIKNGIEPNATLLDSISANPVFEGSSKNIVIITTNNPISEMANWVLWVKGYESYYSANPTGTDGVRNPLGFSVTDPFHKKRFTKDFVVWTGAVSSNWNDSGNWEYNGIGEYPAPGANFNLRYATSVTHGLELTEEVIVQNIDNSTFENMNLGGQQLTITGNVNMNGNGKIIANGEGATVLFKGGAEQIIPDGIFQNNTINNLSIENSGTGVKLGGNLDITGMLTLTDGELNVNNKVLTFKCTGEKSAILAPVISGSVNGDVTVERCIPPLRAFRFMSPSVTTTTSIHDSWQEGATSYTDNPNPGYGTHITGVGTNPDQTDGLDFTPSGNPSLFLYDNASQIWSPIANTDVLPLVAGSCYRLMVRGDRSVDVTDNETDPTFTILRSTGTLAVGNKSVDANQNAGAYNFLGNPYQAIVDMNDVLANSNNLNPNHYYVWDPHTSTRGSFVTVDLEWGITNVTNSQANQFLQPGQAFFVTTAVPGTAAILFQETDKAVDGDFTNMFKPEITAATINLQLYDAQSYLNGGSVVDGVLLAFAEGESNEVLLNDAAKLGNLDENFCSVNGTNYLAIEKRALPLDGEIIPLFVNQYRTNTYTLKVETANFANNVTPYLHDAFLNTDTALPNGISLIDFEIDQNISESIAPDRFSITFNVGELSVDANVMDTFSVYPNPVVDGNFYVSIPGLAGKEVEISVYNILGQRVYASKEKMGADNQLKVGIANLTSGVYVVELEQNANKFTEKLIIK